MEVIQGDHALFPLASATPVCPGNRGLLMLIAEDDQEIAESIGAVVEHVGTAPLVVCDGPRTLDLAQSRVPALVITDLVMPGRGGGALIAALRTQWGAKLSAILVSGAPWMQRRAAGANACLAKPFRGEDLSALLDRNLAARRGAGLTIHQGRTVYRAR